MVIFTDAELVKLMKSFYNPVMDSSGQIKYKIKKLPVQYCVSCYHLGNGCNTQDTICRTMAQEWPFSLQRKDLNNLGYEAI